MGMGMAEPVPAQITKAYQVVIQRFSYFLFQPAFRLFTNYTYSQAGISLEVVDIGVFMLKFIYCFRIESRNSKGIIYDVTDAARSGILSK